MGEPVPFVSCAACQERGKTWQGADPVCAFRNGRPFNPDNWNCATANAIRDICGAPWGDARHPRVDYRFYGDQNFAAIHVPDLELPSGYAATLWISWYKRRGRTDAMWLLSEDEEPRLPTEQDCAVIIASTPG